MLIYPPTLKEGDSDRPVIVFKNNTNLAQNDTHIAFPIPSGIQFADSASYNNTELDFLGSVILNAGRTGASDGLGAAIQGAGNQLLSAVPKDLVALAKVVGASLPGKLDNAAGIAARVMFNKNIVTEFTGMGTRRFGFSFKLISRTREESDLIKEIVNTFRLGLYPPGDSLQLQYPPTWYINFLKDGREIEYIPKIFESYLESVNTTYNGNINLFHADGSPSECDIQLSFVESRSLTREDIEKLIRVPFEKGDFERQVINEAQAAKLIAAAKKKEAELTNNS